MDKIFTDADLKRLKMNLIEPSLAMATDNEFKPTTSYSELILALLSRLEAAEWLAGMAEGPQDAIDAWRRAKGEEDVKGKGKL